MFTELLPLVKDRTLMLIIARTGGETLRVNVIPQRKCAEENDAAENAITSPLTITGMETASFTLRTKLQSALPLYIWQRVRPCTVIILAPRSSAIRANSGALSE